VQEEDCDGLCWQYIINEDKVRPEFVVVTEPTDGNIYRGQRGRMEIRVDVQGVSCHGSAPERGDNAIYKMAEILLEIKELNNRLHFDPFLGKGTVTTSEIFYTSPSRCAVADSCSVSLDRRLTDGETYQMALEEVRNLPSCQKYNAAVSMYSYERPSWTALPTPRLLLPPGSSRRTTRPRWRWSTPSRHVRRAKVDKWTFSTNGVAIMGRYGSPASALAPAREGSARPQRNDLEGRPGEVRGGVRGAADALLQVER
jgi:putative selenium metabolism hydrolase